MIGRSPLACWFALTALLGGPPAAVRAQSADEPATRAYVIATQDVLTVTIVEHADLSGTFTVQPDGTISLPLVGKVGSAGLTVRELEERLVQVLSAGYIRQPRVTVGLQQFRGRRVFVFGNVASPGTFVLSEGQTLMEVLAKAGHGMAAEAVIVRQPSGAGPTLPEHASPGDVIRINLRELEKAVEQGSLAQNVVLRDGDTIFVPRVDPTRIFVSGKVRKPDAYSITEGTTVLQALTLAGGVTEEGAINRLRVLRLVDGKQKTIKVKLTDVLQPGDTLVVPERYF